MVAAAVLFVLLCAINLLVCSLRVALVRERAAFAQPPPDSTGGERAAAAGGARPLRNQIRVLCGTERATAFFGANLLQGIWNAECC